MKNKADIPYTLKTSVLLLHMNHDSNFLGI